MHGVVLKWNEKNESVPVLVFRFPDARLWRSRRLNRNPIASALSLVICFMGLSALFMSLDAFFIGIIQVLVYAGAVMVLFLFIIMLLDLRAEQLRKINYVAVAAEAQLRLFSSSKSISWCGN